MSGIRCFVLISITIIYFYGVVFLHRCTYKSQLDNIAQGKSAKSMRRLTSRSRLRAAIGLSFLGHPRCFWEEPKKAELSGLGPFLYCLAVRPL